MRATLCFKLAGVEEKFLHFPAVGDDLHGAKKDSWFSHIAFGVPGENVSNEWLEPVSDEEYNKLGE